MAVQITHRITTYYKRPRGEPGITSLGSGRIGTEAALDWILEQLPEGSVTVEYEDGDPECVVRIKRTGLDEVRG